jgi:hypothetical protein
MRLRSTEFTPGFNFNGRIVAVDKVKVRARVEEASMSASA